MASDHVDSSVFSIRVIIYHHENVLSCQSSLCWGNVFCFWGIFLVRKGKTEEIFMRINTKGLTCKSAIRQLEFCQISLYFSFTNWQEGEMNILTLSRYFNYILTESIAILCWRNENGILIWNSSSMNVNSCVSCSFTGALVLKTINNIKVYLSFQNQSVYNGFVFIQFLLYIRKQNIFSLKQRGKNKEISV